MYQTGIILNIERSLFHHAFSAINANITTFQIESSSFYSLGNYYTDIAYYEIDKANFNLHLPPVYIRQIDLNASSISYIKNNLFSYYAINGILRLSNECFLNFMGNQIYPKLNQSHWYRNIPSNLGFDSDLAGIASIDIHLAVPWDCMQIINNKFKINQIEPLFPMLVVRNQSGCLSGNIFYNYALDITSARIATCFKANLADNLRSNKVNDQLKCSSIDYGYSQFDFMNLQNEFIFSKANVSAIKLDDAVFAMDNAIFNVLVNEYTHRDFKIM